MGLIGHWPLTKDLSEHTGFNHDIVNFGATLVDRGKFGKAYEFDGSTYMKIESPLNQNIIKNNFSVSFWIYPTAGGKIFTPHSNGIDQSIEYWLGYETILIRLTETSDVNNRQVYLPNDSVPLNKWTNVIISIRDLTVKAYVNGELVLSQTEEIPIGTWSNYWNVAQRGNATGFYQGKLSNIQIFDHEITLGQVKKINQAQSLYWSFVVNEESTANLCTIDTTFESYDLGIIPPGIYNQLGGAGHVLEVSDEHVYEGTKSLKILSEGSSKRSYFYLFHAAGEYITFSAYVYSILPGPYLRIEVNGGDYTWSLVNSDAHTGSGWERLSVTFPAALTSVATGYYFFYDPQSTGLYADNVQVEYMDHNTPFTKDSRTVKLYDSSGFYHSGTFATNEAATWEPYGVCGGSYRFDNNKLYGLYMDQPLKLYYSETAITISFWSYQPSVDTKEYWNGLLGSTLTNGGYIGYHNFGQFFMYLGAGSIWYSGDTPPYDQWVMTTFVIDENTPGVLDLKLYINGKHKVTSTVTRTAVDYFSIDSIGVAENRYFYGSISDIRVHSNILTDKEILDMFEVSLAIDRSGNMNIGVITEDDSIMFDSGNDKILTTPNFSDAGITDGLIGYYPLKYDVIDHAGYVGDGSVVNTIVGMDSLAFDGSSVDIPFGANFNPYTTPLTITMSFSQNTETPIAETMILSTGQNRGNADHNARFYIGFFDGYEIDMGIYNSWWSSSQSLDISYNTELFTKYNIAVTFDAGVVSLFINGIKLGSKTYGTYVFNDNIKLGNHDSSNYFIGDISDVKIFDRILTDEEVNIEASVSLKTEAFLQTSNTLYITGDIDEK